MSVRVRFAPSPTGYLHVGGLRTALYNYLFAKHHGGTFIIRVEDTDQTRFVEGSVEDILTSLDWAGITPDESPKHGGNYGPYTQSERTDLYRKHAYELVEKGMAYYAFDTVEELERMRERQQAAGIAPRYDRSSMRNQYTLGEDETKRLLALGEKASIRLKVEMTGEVKFNDIVRGTIVVPSKDVVDQILLKSDSFPTYHLANVVDDHYMEISHVIRGEEWLPSTPIHVLLYNAFGWTAPQFAHLPLLLNPDKTKLSKRQGHVSVKDYIGLGYFKEAFINFIVLLGWNPSGNREVYSLEELVNDFRLERVNKSGAVFDIAKLNWVNSQYMKHFVEHSPERLVAELQPLLKARGINANDAYVGAVIKLLYERVNLLPELVDFGMYMFAEPIIEEDVKAKVWTESAREMLSALQSIIAEVPADDFNHTSVHTAINNVAKERGWKFKDIGNLLRLALTGKSVGAGMMDTIGLLGKETTLRRIETFLAQH